MPTTSRIPVEANRARAARAIDRHEAQRAGQERRAAAIEAASRAHEANPAVQAYRVELARKKERIDEKIAEAKVTLAMVLSDIPVHRRGRPRKNAGAAA